MKVVKKLIKKGCKFHIFGIIGILLILIGVSTLGYNLYKNKQNTPVETNKISIIRILEDKVEEAKKLEEERIAQEKAEQERLAKEEAERLEQERIKAEQEAKAKAEAEEKARQEKLRQEEQARKVAQANNQNITSRGGNVNRATGTKAELQSYAKQKCKEYGWSDNDYQCLVKLWEKESSWSPLAKNPSSGAYGIPQSLPASKMSSYGADYLTNGYTQINWGLNYIKNRYGNPSNAWQHSVNTGWY